MMEITLTTALIRIGVSLVLGAAIGLERQLHKHAQTAGIRTFTLICMGSALAMLVSIYICKTNTDLLNGDPGRIAAQVLTGIGFIGAGLIIKNTDKDDTHVSGLTTAACVFITSVIGLAAGAGMMLEAAVVTGVTLAILISGSIIRKEK